MKKIVILCGVLVSVSGCGKNKAIDVPMPAGHPQVQLHTTSRIVEKDVSGDSVSQRRAGPQPLMLGPDALVEVYTPVFGATPRTGVATATYFTLEERDNLGGFRLIKPSQPRGLQTPSEPVTTRLSKLSSDYVFALRRFSAAACKQLVEAESAGPANSANKLVEGNEPSVGKIDSFLTLLLGYKAKSGTHLGVSAYKEAFSKMLAASPLPQTEAERTTRLKVSYTHLCVALATDARVYIR